MTTHEKGLLAKENSPGSPAGYPSRHTTGTRKEWLAARLELLEAEKELTRRGDELAQRRRSCRGFGSTRSIDSRPMKGAHRWQTFSEDARSSSGRERKACETPMARAPSCHPLRARPEVSVVPRRLPVGVRRHVWHGELGAVRPPPARRRISGVGASMTPNARHQRRREAPFRSAACRCYAAPDSSDDPLRTRTILPVTPPFPSNSCACLASARGNRCAMSGLIFCC